VDLRRLVKVFILPADGIQADIGFIFFNGDQGVGLVFDKAVRYRLFFYDPAFSKQYLNGFGRNGVQQEGLMRHVVLDGERIDLELPRSR
jgi:hypothetical protein